MKLSLITAPEKLRQLGWDEFISAHPDGTVFQSPDMYELFRGTRMMKPVVIGAADEATGSIKGVLLAVTIREMEGIAGYFSSRTVVYGGPLIDAVVPDKEQVTGELLRGLISAVKNHSIFIQFRNFFSQESMAGAFETEGFHLRDRLNLIVDTSDAEKLRKNMSESRLRQVRKGFELGARCIAPQNIGQVRDFYDILFDLYKYKVKKPLPAWEFFEQFYRISAQGRLGIIRLVEYRGKIIGGILSPVTPGKTIYEWYVCGLDREYREVHPSVLATWAALDHAVKNNIPRFDFMGVGIPERKYGVRDFKKRFGGEIVNYGRFARINNRVIYGIAEVGYNILSVFRKI